MSPVRLTRRLVLEAPQAVPDGAGGLAVTWVALGTLWADVRAGAGRETTGQAVPLGRVAYRITVPAAAPGAPSRPRPDQRLRDGARVFQIRAVAEAGRGFLTCFVEEEEPA